MDVLGKQFTNNVGQKFNEDGSVRTYPGNTIICSIDPSSRIGTVLMEVRRMLESMSCADCFAFLPPSSYHMTVIEGVTDQRRHSGSWTTLLPLDTPLEQVDRLFKQRYGSISVPDTFSMRFHKVDMSGPILIRLLPDSQEDERMLKHFRDTVSEAFGLRFPNHDSYGFHITLAYKIYQLELEEEQALQLARTKAENYLHRQFGLLQTAAPQFVLFKNMFKFSAEREL